MATIYPTLRVPSMYKPFYGIVSAATWNVQELSMTSDDTGQVTLEKIVLPFSYKVEGDLYNGLTLNNKFSTATTENVYGISYDTYLIFKDKADFANGLTTTPNGLVPELLTSTDHTQKRKIEFGRQEENRKETRMLWPLTYDNRSAGDSNSDAWQVDNEEFAFGRQIVKATDRDGNQIKDVTAIEYAIKENTSSSLPSNVYTERYDGGKVDQTLLKDSCTISTEFYTDLKLKAFDGNPGGGINGLCTIYTDEALPSKQTKLFATTTQMFDIGPGPMYITENGEVFYHGSYNENAEYDKKGGDATVRKVRFGLPLQDHYQFSVTQENGAAIKKRVPIGNVNAWTGSPRERNKKTEGELTLYESGITLSHKYTLKKQYRRDIKSIGDIVASAQEIEVSTPGYTGDTFTGTQYKTLIARFIKPDDRTKNKLTVYQLYPVEGLSIIYPANEGGVDAYFKAPSAATFKKEAQATSIAVSTNVQYKVTTSTAWITITKTNYTPSDGRIEFELDATDDTVSARTGTIKVTITEDGVSIPGSPQGQPENTIVIEIVQTRDDVTPVAQQAADAEQAAHDAAQAAQAAQEAADNANQRIDDLEPPEGGN